MTSFYLFNEIYTVWTLLTTTSILAWVLYWCLCLFLCSTLDFLWFAACIVRAYLCVFLFCKHTLVLKKTLLSLTISLIRVHNIQIWLINNMLTEQTLLVTRRFFNSQKSAPRFSTSRKLIKPFFCLVCRLASVSI